MPVSETFYRVKEASAPFASRLISLMDRVRKSTAKARFQRCLRWRRRRRPTSLNRVSLRRTCAIRYDQHKRFYQLMWLAGSSG